MENEVFNFHNLRKMNRGRKLSPVPKLSCRHRSPTFFLIQTSLEELFACKKMEIFDFPQSVEIPEQLGRNPDLFPPLLSSPKHLRLKDFFFLRKQTAPKQYRVRETRKDTENPHEISVSKLYRILGSKWSGEIVERERRFETYWKLQIVSDEIWREEEGFFHFLVQCWRKI